MEKNINSRLQKLSAAALLGAIFILSAVTGKHYGVSWDELPELYVAERNLHYVLTLNPKWLDFSIPVDFAIKGRHPDLPHGLEPWRTFSFGNLLSSIGCYSFFDKLGLLDSISAHHLPNKILFALMLAVVFIFVRRNFGPFAAFAAVIAVAFQPRLWADMQFNLKDFPYACMMAFTLIAVRDAVLKSSWKGILLSAVLLGLAGATKPHAGLIVIITAIWIIFARSSREKVEGKSRTLFLLAVGLAPIIVMVVYYAVWPYLWAHPIENFGKFLDFYLNRAVKGPPNFQWGNLYLFVAVQPPAVLLFGGIGTAMAVFEAVKGIRRELNVLLLLWFFLPVVRIVLPSAYFFDGVRQIIEYSVPLGILTGVGFVYFCKRFYVALANRIPYRNAAVGIVAVFSSVLPLCWGYEMFKIHPYEIAYFNFLVGGAKGAQQRWPTATDYWGSSYRDGMNWLNGHAEPGAIVAVPIANHIAQGVYIIWLRNDLEMLGDFNESLSPESEALLYDYFKKPDKPVYVMYITRRDWYSKLVEFLEKNEKPIYTITVDGAPILKIFKNQTSNQSP